MRTGSRVLVRLPNWVGDAVMASSFLRSVRGGCPGGRISVALRARHEEIFRGSPSVDEFIPIRTASLSESFRLGLSRRGAFDLAFVLPNSFRAALLPWFAGARERVGYRGQGRSLLLTFGLTAPRGERRRRLPEPMPLYWRRLLDAVGIPYLGDRPELAVDEALAEDAERTARALGIAGGERLIGLNPGASFGPSKLWAPERFAGVAALLHGQIGLRAILFTGPGEEDLGRRVLARASSPILASIEAPLGLGLLKALTARCALMVTTDSGPRHIAIALGVPTVTVMGPTDPRYTDYCPDRQDVVIAEGVDCLGCHLRTCPIDHRCMERISAGEVAERALALLKRIGA